MTQTKEERIEKLYGELIERLELRMDEVLDSMSVSRWGKKGNIIQVRDYISETIYYLERDSKKHRIVVQLKNIEHELNLLLDKYRSIYQESVDFLNMLKYVSISDQPTLQYLMMSLSMDLMLSRVDSLDDLKNGIYGVFRRMDVVLKKMAG